METLVLNALKKNENKIEYVYAASNGLSIYFSGKAFVMEYPEKIAHVPSAVLAVPFVCNVLPIIWLEDAELIVPELDEDFYSSIPEFKKGYINMYPDAEFKGKITVGKIVNCRRENQRGSATFFSGGLDATTTLLRHLDEKPDLISIWGSDIAFDNAAGWQPIQRAIDEVAEEYGVKHINIHSSFRRFDREGELEKTHRDKLHDGWWHGVKHGIGLIGHAAPYAWLKGLDTIYIASSNCPSDGYVTCASHPTIDNAVKFCGINVVHDGYEMSRQDKAKHVVEFRKKHINHGVKLHVCWESSDGSNCCHCEKCFRTMTAIWIEGGDPRDFGFDYPENVFQDIYKKMALKYNYSRVIAIQWAQIQEGMSRNKPTLKAKPYYNNIKWIEAFNFKEPEKNWCRRWNRIKSAHRVRGKLAEFEFYQMLHKWRTHTKV